MKSRARLILGCLFFFYSIMPMQAQRTIWQQWKEPAIAATAIITGAAGCGLSNYYLNGNYNLITTLFWPLAAGVGYCLMKPEQSEQDEEHDIVIDQSMFESYKEQLSTDLKAFVTDFETWSKEDKAKISTHGLSFMISDVSREKHAPYGGSIGLWIDCRTQNQRQRILFVECLKYLQTVQ